MNPPITIIDDSLDYILKSIESAKSRSRINFQSSELLIISWNLFKLKKAVISPQFSEFINSHPIDILCFQETKLQPNEVNRYKSLFPQFPYQYWSCCEETIHWAGLAILSKAEAHLVYHGIGTISSLGRVLTVEFDDFFICTCYFPISKTEEKQIEREQWDEELRNFISELKKKKKVVWIGDFNVIRDEVDIFGFNGGIIPYGFNKQERNSFEKNLELGFVDSFRYFHEDERKYSWRSIRTPGCPFGRNWKSRIDYALIDTRLLGNLRGSEIFEEYKAVSDHCPIGITLDFSQKY